MVNELAGNKQLVAYVRPCLTCETEESKQILIATIKVQLTDTLASYMIPSAFIVMDEWPLTHNGKIDRRALPPSTFCQQKWRFSCS